MIFVKKKNYEDNLRPPASASSSKHHHAASTTTDRVNTNRSLNGKYLFDQMPKEMPFSGSRSKCFQDSVLNFKLFSQGTLKVVFQFADLMGVQVCS